MAAEYSWHLGSFKRVTVKMVDGEVLSFKDAEIKIDRPPTASQSATAFLGGAAAHTSAPNSEAILTVIRKHWWKSNPDEHIFSDPKITRLFAASFAKVAYAITPEDP